MLSATSRSFRFGSAGSRAVVVIALVAFLGSITGIPVFEVSSAFRGKDRSQPFPCQDRACGCQSAAACWQGCCCFSAAQKVAWAKQNGVQVPEFVLVAARTDAAAKKSACCASGHDPSNESQPASRIAQRERTPTRRGTWSRDAESGDATVKIVSGIQARHCRGDGPLWLALGAALPPEPEIIVDAEVRVVGSLPVVNATADSLAQRPPVPPPRACAAV